MKLKGNSHEVVLTDITPHNNVLHIQDAVEEDEVHTSLVRDPLCAVLTVYVIATMLKDVRVP